jgi:hypothetical protein
MEASGFLMYALCSSFIEQTNKESRMHLFDPEAGSNPPFLKEKK